MTARDEVLEMVAARMRDLDLPTCQPRKLANQLRGMADATTPTSKEQQR